ncbi:MAG TPA: hypothetical protein PKL77_09135 [Candidatus Omnitrophota bacterium]|nr:hypothetical protein [Candidatus Omnitrophota bacterium]HPT06925.1 hypothetical protein [Candidatus Omnitrophota bacterium]
MNDDNARLVYSTSVGSICPGCSQPVKACICRQMKKKALPATDEKPRLRYEIADRKGKGVTLITGLPLSEEGLLDLAKKLKSQFGTGGSVKDGVLELQGDQREKASAALHKLGYSL